MSKRVSLAEALAKVVRDHGHVCAVTAEGTLIAESVFTVKMSDGSWRGFTQTDPLPANINAVRNWLGY